MPQMQVSATRMELMRVRRRLSTATRGHSLLKDKLDGLMQEFLGVLDDYKNARRALEERFPDVLRAFVLAGLSSSSDAIATALTQARGEATVEVQTHNVAGVAVPSFKVDIQTGGGFSLLDTPFVCDEAVADLREHFPDLLRVAELEHAVYLLVAEIERTRRRVNALEYIMIPSLRETMRSIRMKLDEMERGNTIRLMKIKDMRLAQQRREAAEGRAGSVL
jgi:V/A-type H+/Na+-transporting ATPase subunit D